MITGVSFWLVPFYSHPPFDGKGKYLEQIRRSTDDEQCLVEFYKTLRCLESLHSVCCVYIGLPQNSPHYSGGVTGALRTRRGKGKQGLLLPDEDPAWSPRTLRGCVAVRPRRPRSRLNAAASRLRGSGKTPAFPAFSLLTGIITSAPRSCCEAQMKGCVWEGVVNLYHTINTHTSTASCLKERGKKVWLCERASTHLLRHLKVTVKWPRDLSI